MTSQLAVIACPSMKPELELLAAGDCYAVTYLDMGLHERAAGAMREALQGAIDAVTGADAIAIAYGLCNGGIIGVEARDLPLALPRAHDCIGILLGSSRRYLEEMARQPGTYYQSAGWLKAARETDGFTFGPNSNASLEALCTRYGEEEAAYLKSAFEGFISHYSRLAYIATPAGAGQEKEVQAIAQARGWAFDRLDGDGGWLQRLLRREWAEEEFLVVAPGCRIVRADDESLIRAAP